MEKRTQGILHNYISDKVQDDYLFYSPTQDITLKKVFSKCSKSGINRGIPDLVIYNKGTLIVFECKPNSIHDAYIDLEMYKNKMDYESIKDTDIYFIAFIDVNNYKCYDKNLKELDMTIINIITKNNIGLNKSSVLLKKDMDKKIVSIHNYIRDCTKISNEDKPFFIAIILISLKKESFRLTIENYSGSRYIYDLLVSNIQEFKLDTGIFEFMRDDNNNKHFLNIIRMTMDIFTGNINDDLLNTFYSEFVRYGNTDSKSLGIVLTPDHIGSFMAYILNINENDIVFDICTGTGSLLLKCLPYKPKKIVGCEYQNKLFSLLEANRILRDITNSEFYKNDCFNIEFSGTKSTMNPPYGMKDKIELEFILKQIQSTTEGGLATSIIPIKNLSKPHKVRREISNISKVRAIIICNEKLFHNSKASVKVCILLLEKDSINGHCATDRTKIIDYTNDGYTMKRGRGRVKNDDFDIIYSNLLKSFKDENNYYHIDINGDWTKTNKKFTKGIDIFKLKKNLLDLKNSSELLDLHNTPLITSDKDISFRDFKISELFEILKKPKDKYTKKHVYVNNIAAKKCNNGVKEQILCNENTFTGNKIVLVMSGDGGAGLAYYQERDFIISSATCVISPINIHLDRHTGIYCANELSKYKSVYSHGYTWTLDKIKNDTITLPINDDKTINYKYIESLFS